MPDPLPHPWLAPRLPFDSVILPSGTRFSLSDRPPAARFIFRGGEAARLACSTAFDADLPLQLGSAGVGDERTAFWLGPDEWLLIAEGVDPEMMAAEIEAALVGSPHSLVDVSHRQVGLDIRGADAVRALSAGCPLDLRVSAFPMGMATRTIFDKVEIVLWRREETAFRVEVWRSFAAYLVAALNEAARGAPSL
ncbi:MAG TPA: sarcosine oxidase subunit gamma family protein [Roseiarcus sp.]|nr:sarcosine oxidase subunit gamma family protein [Roseiarcus sp.]